jgi:hypothetical protein
MTDDLLDRALQKIQDEGLEKIIPSRRKGEKKKKFVERCMGSPVMNEEFPDRGTRFAVCSRQAEKKRKK